MNKNLGVVGEASGGAQLVLFVDFCLLRCCAQGEQEKERRGSLFSLQECGVMWAILFDSISVFPLKGRARANEEKLMDFKNRDGRRPALHTLEGSGKSRAVSE